MAMAGVLALGLLVLVLVLGVGAGADVGGTIAFSTLGRLSFNFDVYTVALGGALGGAGVGLEETRVTFGESVSYNAQLVEAEWGSAVLERLRRHGHELQGSEAPELLVYVSEDDGSPQLYLDIPLQGTRVHRFLFQLALFLISWCLGLCL